VGKVDAGKWQQSLAGALCRAHYPCSLAERVVFDPSNLPVELGIDPSQLGVLRPLGLDLRDKLIAVVRAFRTDRHGREPRGAS
jgi:hypothetical protein